MKKKIPSSIAILIILAIAIVLGASFWTIGKKLETTKMASNPKFSKSAEPACAAHAYSGEAKVRGWFADDKKSGKERIFQIIEEDIKLLPKYDGTDEFRKQNSQFKLVDVDLKAEKTLKNASEKKPATVTITGYMQPCDGMRLASLNYKDGIFRNYLND